MLCVFSIFICLSGCGSRALKPKHSDCELWAEELEGANPKFVEDYIFIWDLIENEYPLLETSKRITGKNFEDIKQKYYYRISLYKTQRDFFNYIVIPCLSEFEGTGHLQYYSDIFYKYVYSLYKENIDELPYIEKFNYQQLTRQQSKNFYADVIKEADTNSDLNIESSINFINNLDFSYYPEKSTAYVKINSMTAYFSLDNAEYKALSDFFSNIEKQGYKNCIIDVRDNPGGCTMYWSDGILKPNITKSIAIQEVNLVKGELSKNYLDSQYNLKPISSLDITKFPNLNTDDYKDCSYYSIIEERYEPSNNGPLFTGKFWVLVNEKCYSATEAFVKFCKDSKFATIVGQTTGGDGVGTTPITFSLPNTGICIRFSASLGLNSDGSGNEEFGTTPDIEINSDEDALEKCLELIK